MIRHTVLFFLFLLLIVNVSWSQDSLVITQQKMHKSSIEQAKIQEVVDTLLSMRTDKDLPVVIQRNSGRDSLKYDLKDYDYTSRIDSMWLSELTNAYLYDSINNIVHYKGKENFEISDIPTDTLKKRLALLNAKTPFNIEYNPALESVIERYLRRHRPTMERLMGLSEFYFPTFEATFDKYDIPLELKYLAIVESALRPRAKSRVGATGIWQFMYGTGKLYGLEVSSYVDERMDPIMSTEAASKYLSKLYGMFGDWDLALAAYNSGPGNVAKAIRRSGGRKNYWNIRHFLPRETAGYVPAFFATLYLFEYGKDHGYHAQKPLFNHFETDTIRVKQAITLEQVSKFTNVSLEEIQFLNPSYKLDIIPFVKKENYYIRLPLRAIGPFVTYEDEIYKKAKEELARQEETLPEFLENPKHITYRVRSGDYLGKIAGRYGVRVSQIKRWNGLRSNNLRIGQRLIIYPKRSVTSTSKTSKTTSKAVATNAKTYIVKKGDSLWTIARKFPGISADNLKVWNDISGNKLKPGMKLVVSN